MTDRAIVFDLFHTLIDPEPFRPADFDRPGAVASICGLDRTVFAEFWAATYVERETTTIDLLDLVERCATAVGIELDDEQRVELDAIFGAAEDTAILQPDDRLVTLVAGLATSMRVGVLSNCHEHEVRRWSHSPFASHVRSFGRSSRIGVMKPDLGAYSWIIDALDAEATTSIYVGNGSSNELIGARHAGFGTVVHCNAFDLLHGAVEPAEQRRRADQADESVDTVDELVAVIEHLAMKR